MGNGTGPRPLSELSPMSQRRNSPSWNQKTKMMMSSSPFDSSPYNPSSPRLFWQGRDSNSSFQSLNSENAKPYDPEGSYTPSKRPSLEKLKRASRVKNSKIFAREQKQEYDPAHLPVLNRPLASGRPFHSKSPASPVRQTGQNKAAEAASSPQPPSQRPPTPSKGQASPAKSSLSKATRFGSKPFDPQKEIWTDCDGGPNPQRFADEQAQSRQAKSVTFDAAPPQVNEYEMTTPDPSSIASESRDGSYDSDEEEADVSFDRDSSLDHDDSFDASLEDVEKTPVVLPEDWRFMSPDSANDELVRGEEDPFVEEHGSPNPDTLDSNGERRPLPPLPSSKPSNQSPHLSPSARLSAAFELGSSGQRALPSPPGPASYSKTEISEMSRGSMTLEDRLRLMMLQEQDQGSPQSDAERERERRMRRAGAQEESNGHEFDRKEDDSNALDDMSTPPRISRESILRNIKNTRDMSYDESYEYSSQPSSSPAHLAHYDPDVPIPSLEVDDEADALVKEEQTDDEDIYAIPEYHESDEHEPDDDDQSHYSRKSTEELPERRRFSSGSGVGQTTPVPTNRTEEHAPERAPVDDHHNEFSASTNSEDDRAETASPRRSLDKECSDAPEEDDMGLANFRESLQRAMTPEDQSGDFEEEPSTPESVIRHPISYEPEDESADEAADESADESSEEEPVPEPIATIKAPGTGLKTRPSLTPADVQSMAAARRKVSGQEPPPMPSLRQPEPDRKDSSTEDIPEESDEGSSDDLPPQAPTPAVAKRQSSLVKLDIPLSSGESLGFGLDKEFDRVIEAQKRGYLMRQNTKVIIASSHNDDESQPSNPDAEADPSRTKPANPSPRKTSQPTWTAEPWNPKTRRQSLKSGGGALKKKPSGGVVPPLPGMSSSVQDAQPGIDEIDAHAATEHYEEGQERGRLFVKVIAVKDLDLPLPKGERLYFSLTLDNGLHCVTTSWLELGNSAPIGQEFELIVQNELEFQLTLQMKVEGTMLKQPRESIVPSSPVKHKTSTFSRVFASPRKRKEMELRQQLEQQQKQKADAKANAGPWDKLRTLVDRDGSFARAYVCLSDHEKHAFGRPYSVQVSCFNEWAVEEPTSLKSKKSSTTNVVQKKPPYKIGNLELQLLYVPKPKGAKDEDMPKSMNACIREMREAENAAARTWEGFLSQQGGDCPYWRRRFFRLQGSKLTAYHEVTRQPRATINLAKAAKLIDDKTALTQKETSTKGGGRRKSAFAEEEEGYMFVEEGFRIRFANGEVIDFYADSRPEKEGWMKVLSEVVGKGYAAGSGQVKAWTELVLRHERAMNAKREAADRLLGNGPAAAGQPPKKEAPALTTPKAQEEPVQQTRPRHQHHLSQPQARILESRREKARSVIW
ncbi:hypothetical protein VTN77DRAFT_1630 [Rasamsonia byssochlamydoides]|uniref:uncharacterized protein n=1 Tax=Rasamsonia byssochlamydoides TaxID=89139 RepID=UPI003743AC03